MNNSWVRLEIEIQNPSSPLLGYVCLSVPLQYWYWDHNYMIDFGMGGVH
jgi:hypothetical protein